LGEGVINPMTQLLKLDDDFRGRTVYRWLNPAESLEPQKALLLSNRWRNVDPNALIVAEVASREVALIESLIQIGFRPVCSTISLVLSGQHPTIYRNVAGYRVRPGDLVDRQRWGELFFPERSLACAWVDRSTPSGHSRNALSENPHWNTRSLLVAEEGSVFKSVALVVIDRSEASVARLEVVFQPDASWLVVAHLIQESVRWLQEEDKGRGTVIIDFDVRHWELIGLVLKLGFVARQTATHLHWSNLPVLGTSSVSTSSASG
jgi:hypothetical protein